MKLKRNLQASFYTYILGIPIIFIVSLLGFVYTNNLNPLMFGFLLAFFFTVLHAVRYYGMLSLYAIYLYTSAFFIYDCIIFTLFGDKNFLLQYFPLRFSFEERTGSIFLIACYATVFITHIAYCLIPKNRYIVRMTTKPIVNNFILQKTGEIFMLVFLVPVLYKIYVQLSFIRLHGYLSIFDGSMADIHYPFWCMGSFIFFIGGYVIFFASNPPKKRFILFSFLFLLVYGFNSLKGQRGPIISAFLVTIFLIGRQYRIQIKLKYLIVMLITIIGMVVALGNIRASYGDEKKNKSVIDGEFVAEIVYGQTTSRAVPLLIMDRKLDFHPYPFVFSPLLIPYYAFFYPSNGQDRISAEHHNNISQVTMYNLSPSTHLNGGGFGGAFLAEAYDCGGFIGIIIWSIVIAFILVQYDFGLNVIPIKYRPLLFFYLLNIPTLSRGRLFGVMYDLNKIIFVYMVLLLVDIRKYFKLRVNNE